MYIYDSLVYGYTGCVRTMCKNKETKTFFINTFVNINIYSPADDWLFMKVRSVDKIAILPLPVVLYLPGDRRKIGSRDEITCF